MHNLTTPHRKEGSTTTAHRGQPRSGSYFDESGREGNGPIAHRAQPRSMSYFDDFFRLRKGTAMRAARNGQLRAVFRRGRGGIHAYAFPEDGDDWFRRGLPTEPQVTP